MCLPTGSPSPMRQGAGEPPRAMEANGTARRLERLREAEAILKALLADKSGDPGYRKRLADTINARGVVHYKIGQYPDALAAFREFQGICQTLLDRPSHGTQARQPPQPAGPRLLQHGLYDQQAGETAAREEVAADVREVARMPVGAGERPSRGERLPGEPGAGLAEITDFRHKAGRDEDALAGVRRSIEILEGLVATLPDQPRHRAELGHASHVLGYLFDEKRDNELALEALLQRARRRNRRVREAPESDRSRIYLSDILWNLGEQYVDLGRVPDGLPHYRRSSRHQAAAPRQPPERPIPDSSLAEQLAMLATVERHGGDSASARRDYAEAAALLEPIDLGAGDSEVQVLRAGYLIGEAVAAADHGPIDQALPTLQKAVAILTRFVATAKDDPRPRQRLTEALWQRARLLRH